MPSHTSLVIKNEEVFKKLKEIAFREGKDISELTFEMYEKYIKEHGEGNPQTTLDNPIICTPALFRDSKIIHDYMMKCKDDEFSTHKFKLNEWNHAFKQRYGEYP